MTFAELIHAVHTHPQHVVVPGLWGQGRATFGGLVAAMLYEAMRLKVPAGSVAIAGRMAAAEILGRPCSPPPRETAMGALIAHITGDAEAKTFQPMNVNFGLFPPIDARGGRKGRGERYKAYTDRAKEAFTAWL